MKHPTKAIFKILQHDAVKVGQEEGRLFDEKDMLAAMDKIELINYHQTLEHKGVRFTCYNAGHVLGAEVFTIGAENLITRLSGFNERKAFTHASRVGIQCLTVGVSLQTANIFKRWSSSCTSPESCHLKYFDFLLLIILAMAPVQSGCLIAFRRKYCASWTTLNT